MWKNRKYKTGSKWALWRWTFTDAEYITRLHLIKTPWFAICLHWFWKPDPEPHLHDHPVTFLSLILKGGYTERRWQSGVGPFGFSVTRTVMRNWYNWIRASELDCHKIIQVKPGTLSLCFMGPKTREWGFHTEDGWVYWRDYNKAKYESTP